MVILDIDRKYKINSTQQRKLKDHYKHVKSILCVNQVH